METICAWCGVRLSDNPTRSEGSRPISHGICSECASRMLMKPAAELERLLNQFEMPVFLVDDDGRVNSANQNALKAVNKPLDVIEGLLGGDVFECIHASEPGGCGNTIHCAACTIRNAVEETHRTGVPQVRIPATLDAVIDAEHTLIRYRITTELVEDHILLRIDEVMDDEEEAGECS